MIKPTGSHGGASNPLAEHAGSGTNDKAGSYLTCLRWVSPRTIKETLIPATEFQISVYERLRGFRG